MKKGYITAILAALTANSGNSDLRFDANETAFLEREITQLRAKVLDVLYGDNIGMSFVPLATDIDPTADTYSTPVLDRKGRAKVIGNGVNDIPRIDVTKDEILGTVKTIAASYGYTIMELRKAAANRVPIEVWKPRAARSAIDDEIDEMLAKGQTTTQTGLGVTGLVNHASVTVKTDHFTVWAPGDTAEALLAELAKPATTINVAVKGKASLIPDTLLIAPSMYDIIANKPVGNVSEMTVLRWFLANNPYIKQVSPWPKLETANAGGTAQRSVMYRKDPSVLEGVVPVPFEQLPPQAVGLELITNCFGKAGGVKVYQPGAMLYIDHTG